MNCEEVRRFVELYVDGEFDTDERVSFEQHLQACEECRRLESSERTFRAILRKKLPPISAPAAVRTRVSTEVNRLAGERRGFGEFFPYQVAALALAASLLVVLWWPFDSGRTPLQSAMIPGDGPSVAGPLSTESPRPESMAGLQTDAVRPARATTPSFGRTRAESRAQLVSYSRLPADVRGGTSDIQQYMQSRVPFVVHAPLIPSDALRLVGARQIVAAGQPAVLYIYEVGGERVNIVQTARNDGSSKAQALALQREGTTTWGRFVREGVLHLIVSELDPHQLSLLVRNHLAP